tara:strand:- start:2100 stop:2870 length:771 start_codon:yes stop_codon:yes gene_type:complete
MASQITPMQPGNHQPMGVDWAGTDVESEENAEDRDSMPNGTDYKPVKKSYRLYKSLIQDEDLLKAMDEDEEEKEKHFEGAMKDDKDHIAALERDEEEEKRDEEDAKMRKSFFEVVEENPVLLKGISSSPFLYEMVKSIGYSFLNLEDQIGTQMLQMDMHHDQFAKSVDGVFENMSKSLGFINDTADQVDMHKSVSADGNVQYLEKGNFSGEAGPSQGQVLQALVKGVEAGHISPTEVIKFETTGAVSPHIQKSLGL